MRPFLALVFALAAILFARPQGLHAAELLMFEAPACPYCKVWHAQVGIGYPKSDEGKRAPLRVVQFAKARDLDVALASPVIVSPTFVLVENNKEVGRIIGYPGADFFWALLGELMVKLDARPHSLTRAVSDLIEPAPFGRGAALRQERSEERTGGTVEERDEPDARRHRTRSAGAFRAGAVADGSTGPPARSSPPSWPRREIPPAARFNQVGNCSGADHSAFASLWHRRASLHRNAV